VRGELYLSGRKKKIRPDLDGTTTLALLEKVAAEALRLRDENKRLAAELKTALKRAKPARKIAPETAAAAAPVVEKKAVTRRQALGTGLARFLRARRTS
jgi:hypothetical protein